MKTDRMSGVGVLPSVPLKKVEMSGRGLTHCHFTWKLPPTQKYCNYEENDKIEV